MVQVMELENGNIVHFEWQSDGSLYDLNEEMYFYTLEDLIKHHLSYKQRKTLELI